MSTSLRIGLIGSGKMGLQHLKAIRQIEGATVVGVADPAANEEALRPLLPADTRIVDSAATLLAELRPDIVHIVTPPSTHVQLAVQALEAGSHVYVEKPFTVTLAEATRVFETASARGLRVCAGHQYLFERPALLAKEHLAEIGRLVHIESVMSFRMVRKTITPADQAKDILPHAVYPLLEQLRLGSGNASAPFEIRGIDVHPQGDVYALLRLGSCTGILIVTLSGRPIEQYQNLIGTNGSLRADYITGSLTRLAGPGTGPGVLFTPYRRSWQTLSGATRGFSRLIFKRQTSYPGLRTLIERFYTAVSQGQTSPLSPRSILDTVDVCERIGNALDEVDRAAETTAGGRLQQVEAALPAVSPGAGVVLVTGGTGFLGKPVVEELRHAGFPVRVVARRVPPLSSRVPGVEYVVGDLSRALAPTLFDGVGLVVHCAAETAGGKEDHERNSIAATRHMVEAAARAGVKRFIHISSLAVLLPGRKVRGPLDENTPVDSNNIERGPYVWGKAAAEEDAQRLAKELGVQLKVLRPGPLVDYASFHPPGRLGREVGTLFVAVGSRRSRLSVCDVGTAARVIRAYAEDFDAAPAMLNMVEGDPPTRGALVDRMRATRPDLSVFWLPSFVLRMASGPLKLVQRIALGSEKPLDVYAAFASERYRTDLAAQVIERAGASRVRPLDAPAPTTAAAATAPERR